jgi:bifunctional enzyme CysN/CysC
MARKPSTRLLEQKSILQIEKYDELIEFQRDQDLLRFITCGSVDDGKSTLIGRLLWESRQVFDDQLESLKVESQKYGTQGNNIDFALLVDGLSAEREQGITIDVAYRFFATRTRKFIVADSPGHEQYTRNMVTAASTAQAAILLIDARSGLLEQTRRHAYLVSLMGIRHVILAINKMDLVAFNDQVFNQISKEFRQFSIELNFQSITPVPISALHGDNIIRRSGHTPWYHGPTLLSVLETIEVAFSKDAAKPIFPVQWVNRPDSSFRGYSGTLTQGALSIGDTIRVTHTGISAAISKIITMDGPLASIHSGQAVTICLDREIDISRGDVLTLASSPIETTDQFEATLVWLNPAVGLAGRNYEIKLSTQTSSCSITAIKHSIDINSLKKQTSSTLQQNDIAICNMATSRALAFETYQNAPSMGSFILIDRLTNATLAAGMINHSLRRAHNIHRQALTISRDERERLNGHKGKVIWLTGLSGSGKSTIANALEIKLHEEGYRTFILDGDNVRHGLNKDLGFTEADRVENMRRIAEVAKLMLDAGLVVITAFISPFHRERQMARELIGLDFLEVHVSTPLEVCEARDPKGLYKQARAGKIPNMTGINSPYEAPMNADIELDSSSMTLPEMIAILTQAIKITRS